MAEIEIVIKIDKDIAQGIIDGEKDAPRNIVRAFQATIADAIKNGTPLPEGHGDLKDMEDIYEALEGWEDDTGWIVDSIDCEAPTIIEADKENF